MTTSFASEFASKHFRGNCLVIPCGFSSASPLWPRSEFHVLRAILRPLNSHSSYLRILVASLSIIGPNQPASKKQKKQTNKQTNGADFPFKRKQKQFGGDLTTVSVPPSAVCARFGVTRHPALPFGTWFIKSAGFSLHGGCTDIPEAGGFAGAKDPGSSMALLLFLHRWLISYTRIIRKVNGLQTGTARHSCFWESDPVILQRGRTTWKDWI